MHLHFCSCLLWTSFLPPHTCYCWLVLETCEQPTCTLVPICSFFSHSQICHTPHTEPPLHACLARAIRQKFNNVPWQKLCQKPKTGSWYMCAFWKMQGNYALSWSLSKIFLKPFFKGPKLGPDMCMHSEICNGTPVLVHVKIHIIQRKVINSGYLCGTL